MLCNKGNMSFVGNKIMIGSQALLKFAAEYLLLF